MKRSAAGMHKRVRRTSLTLSDAAATAPSLPPAASDAGMRASAALRKMPRLGAAAAAVAPAGLRRCVGDQK
jgi:hypothetical protein